ncbi:flagellar biosynthetic protein FliO [Luminiphilus sp.]|nr:flagellar biosynthetic protein FliO [Luminiphilus sp.]MDC3251016.1 flagellar biosynthetic protein FliO [Luminiphilus sp.]MDC3316554.1 flagellar biosynthetic protein FliO [bacterium]
MMRYFLAFIAFLSMSASADEAQGVIAPSELFTGDYLVRAIGSFSLVIFLLVIVLLLVKRFTTVSIKTSGYIQVLSSVALGQKERVVLLQVGVEQVLVGVTPGEIRRLHTLSERVTILDDESKSFSDIWSDVISRQRSDKQ